MTIELWGTFSVRDHIIDRAFVADVLLYDRLVIPTLPEGDSEATWPREWELAKQKSLLGDLGDLAIAIPWDKSHRDTWQKRFDDQRSEERRQARAEAAKAVASDVADARDPQNKDLSYNVTRIILQDMVNQEADNKLYNKLKFTEKLRPGSKLEAVSAYPSYDHFAADVPEHPVSDSPVSDDQPSPTSLFRWQFFVPDSPDRGEKEDRKLLAQAIKLASKPEFIEMRGYFYAWWSDFLASGLTGAEARTEMEKRIAEYQKIFKGQGWKTVTRYGIKLADACSGGLGLVDDAVSAGSEAFFGTADVFLDPRLKQQKAQDRLKVAAIFHDARNRLRRKSGIQFPWKS
jgi:hypothetical protein